MMTELMRECNNFFEVGKIEGNMRIVNGALYPSTGIHNGWVAVSGSACHDGVYWCEDGVLMDADESVSETFVGTVWLLCPPSSFVKLGRDVDDYVQKTPVSAVAAETFGMYSRTLSKGQSGGVLTWQEAFSKQLKPYRRMFTEVHV